MDRADRATNRRTTATVASGARHRRLGVAEATAEPGAQRDAGDGLRAQGRDRLLRRQAGGQGRLDGHPPERDHRPDRPLGLRQEHADPLPQPDERPDPERHGRRAASSTTARTSTGRRSTRSRSASGSAWSSRSRTRSRSRSTTTSPSAPGCSASTDIDERVERALRRAALWDEVKDRLDEQRLRDVGRPAAAALHRPLHRGRPRRDPDGRALLGARPDLDRQDRGPDARAEGASTRS